ncbi:MAG: ABC transporter permease [Candidatus Acidiferrum sp.]
MPLLVKVRSVLRNFFLSRQVEADLDQEVHSHLEMLTEENISAGMSPQEAQRAARIELGGLEQVKEQVRAERLGNWLHSVISDCRYGLRQLRKDPGFATAAVLTLAFGIGASTAVFSVVDRILFRSLPYSHDEHLVIFGLLAPIEPREFMLATDYVDWRTQQTPFEATTTVTPGNDACDLTEQNPVRLTCAHIEYTFLTTFGIQPILGRNFTREEGLPHAPRVALVSFELWRTRFAGDSQVMGRRISLDGQPTTIVGVLPSDFEMPTLGRADILVPQAFDEAALRRDGPQPVLHAFARLKPGVGIAQSAAALQPLFEKSLQYVPPMFRKEVRLSVRSLRDRQVQDARLASWILFAGVSGVLLVGCTNVANLLLARGASRRHELAVRAALGATRARLARQALTESVVLSVFGGAVGCWIAYALLRLFVSIAPEGIPHLQQASLDHRVLLFALGISLISGLLSGLVPALHVPAPEGLSGKEARATTRGVLRQTLVAAQIAISLTLFAGAGLLLRSLHNLQSVHLGMSTENALVAKVMLGESRYPDTPRQIAFFNELEPRLKQIPGIASIALSDSLPPSGEMRATIYSSIEIPGRGRLAEGTGGMVGWRSVTPGYFSALQIPVVRGRSFREEDRARGENPVILNESLARQLFPNEDPLGKNMRPRPEAPWRTVVGIAADVKNNGVTQPADLEYYIPWKADEEGSFRTAYVILRTPMNSRMMASWIRTEISGLDATIPMEINTLSQRVNKLAARPRFNAMLISLFAAMGVLLAAIGIYGVVGFLVAQKTREIGVRIALGATPRNIQKMVLSNVARWTIAGAGLGLFGAWFCAQMLASLLFEVRVHDPILLGIALLFLLAVAFFAAWIPARRAARIDPMVALRYE